MLGCPSKCPVNVCVGVCLNMTPKVFLNLNANATNQVSIIKATSIYFIFFLKCENGIYVHVFNVRCSEKKYLYAFT